MRKVFFTLGLALFFLVAIWGLQRQNLVVNATTGVKLNSAEVTIGTKTFTSEIADTQEKQINGLSNRAQLAPNEAMTFPLPNANQPSFWMKDMRFPIDIVWIKNNQVVSVSKNLPIPTTTVLTALPLYPPPAVVDYALEVNAGTGNFNSGDKVVIKFIEQN